MTRRRLAITCTFGLALATTGLAAGDATAGEGGGSITFWSSLIEPERIAIQEGIIAAFTEASGIEVELVPVPEDDLGNLIVTNAASGDLPDVVATPLDFSIG